MLTESVVRTLKPAEKIYRRYDAKGLYVEVRPSGSRLWRFRYELDGKSKLISLGSHPDVTLKQARDMRDAKRAELLEGIDPSAARKARKASQDRAQLQASSFEAVAREWHSVLHEKSVVASHAERNIRRLILYVFPKIGERPISEIEPPEVLALLRGVEKTKPETAKRVKALIGQVFRYGIATGRCNRDQTADLKGMLSRTPERHHPAVTDPGELPGLLRAIDGYKGYPATIAALKLSALLFVRPGELRRMEWASLDLDAGQWDYQPSKGGRPLTVPLPHQAVEILEEMQAITGRDRWVFPSAHGKGRPMSENTISAALHRMGYKDQMSAHGFRAMARTVLEEHLHQDPRFIEMQLGHAVRDANGRAYNRTTFLEQRREMLQTWADYLDGLRRDGTS
jgi:integrase